MAHTIQGQKCLGQWDLLVAFPSEMAKWGLRLLLAASCHWWQNCGVALGLLPSPLGLLCFPFPETKNVLRRTMSQCLVQEEKFLCLSGLWDLLHQVCFAIRAIKCSGCPTRLVIPNVLIWEVQDHASVSVFIGPLWIWPEVTWREGHDSISLEAEGRLLLTPVIIDQLLLCSVPAIRASTYFSINRKHHHLRNPCPHSWQLGSCRTH